MCRGEGAAAGAAVLFWVWEGHRGRAVALNEISFCRLKARMKAGSHQRSKRGFETARVVKRAVAIDEIIFNQLKARKETGSHQSSKRGFVTARVAKRAVAIKEIIFSQLLD